MKKSQMVLIGLLCFGVFLTLLTYTLIAPLLPSELLKRDISSLYNGVIIGFYSVMIIPMGPLVHKCIAPRLGYKRVYSLGALVIALANLAYGFCFYVPYSQRTLFIALNIFVRVVQGVGATSVYQICFILLCLIEKENLGRAVSLLSFASTLGVAVGPSIAGVLFSLLGYVGPFLVVGGVSLLFTLAIYLLEWDYAQPVAPAQQVGTADSASLPSSRVRYSSFCANKLSLVCLVAIFMRVVVITFYPPTLALKLELVYGFDSDEAAYFYSLETVFAFASNLLLILFPIKKAPRLWTSLSLLGTIVGVFLMGPSALLRLPESIYLMGVGTAIMGGVAQVLSIASVVVCAESMKQRFPGEEEHVSNILGSYRVTMAGLALAVSPFYASIIQKLFSYSVLCDSIALILTAVLVAFLWISHRDSKSGWTMGDQSLSERLLEGHPEH